MPLFKFSLIYLLLTTNIFAIEDNQCLKGIFDVEVIHKGQPFGLLPVKILINKKECIINITHEKLKFFKNNWEVDVCREPVHIKNGRGAVEVLKKLAPCEGDSNSSFCVEQKTLFQAMQDDGLIFAPGEKENLGTDHGKVYCTYLLIRKYLKDSLVFNRGQDYKGVLSGDHIGNSRDANEKVIEKEITEEAPAQAPRPTVVGSGSEPEIEEDEGSSAGPSQDQQERQEEKQGAGSF